MLVSTLTACIHACAFHKYVHHLELLWSGWLPLKNLPLAEPGLEEYLDEDLDCDLDCDRDFAVAFAGALY